MTRRMLVPYAGAEQQRLRPRDDRRQVKLLESIVRRQKQGMLLSEIGVALGSAEMVRSTVKAWLWRVAQ